MENQTDTKSVRSQVLYKSGTAELSFVSFIRDGAFICIATSQSPSLLRTLTTAYNLGMCLLALPMIYVQNSILEVALNGYNRHADCFSVNEKERFVWERYPIYRKRLM